MLGDRETSLSFYKEMAVHTLLYASHCCTTSVAKTDRPELPLGPVCFNTELTKIFWYCVLFIAVTGIH
jgi:hypothetical protein